MKENLLAFLESVFSFVVIEFYFLLLFYTTPLHYAMGTLSSHDVVLV